MINVVSRVGYVEGLSFILLLFVAMPLKYAFEMPAMVTWIGSAHGFLFLLYIGVLAVASLQRVLPIWAFPLGVLAAILPFGPFVFDGLFLSKYRIVED